MKKLQVKVLDERMKNNLPCTHQAQESREHAQQFQAVLAKAEKRFAALKRVEQRHAEAYQLLWESV